MSTIIVLTDFSESANNAARYAAGLATSFENCTLMLIHAYADLSKSVPIDLPDIVNEASIQNDIYRRLRVQIRALEPYKERNTHIDCLARPGSLAVVVGEVAEQQDVKLIVAGGKHHSAFSTLLFGSSVLTLIESCPFPLLIIPPATSFHKISRLVFACDLKDVERLPVEFVHSITNNLRARLIILNIDTGDPGEPDEIASQLNLLHARMDRLHPDYHFFSSSAIPAGIASFSVKQQAEMIVLVHKKHTQLYKLFHHSTSKDMAEHAALPMLILQEGSQENTPAYYSYSGRYS